MNKTRIGIDVGAVFLKVAVLDGNNGPQELIARRHRGNPVSVAREELEKIGIDGEVAVGVTGSNSKLLAGGLNIKPVDFVQAEIESVKKEFPDVRNIINVGGGSVTLIQLDEEGNFIDYTTNSLCAAGTGSFLDQQAERMGVNYDDMKSFAHEDNPPPIATRCSVFAKSDLIHRQQEGYNKSQLWCGLCKGMTSTFLNVLLRGRPLKGLTVITGGVSKNAEVMSWLKARYGDQVQTFENASFTGAIGSAYLTDGYVDGLSNTISDMHDAGRYSSKSSRRKPLRFRRTKYPSFEVAESWVDDEGNEVRITRWPDSKIVLGYLGIDIGSTSTKLVLIDENENVIADVYRKTGGAPIDATRMLFSSLLDVARQKGSELKILGAGTTGSGRKLIGTLIGADLVVNEITAHLTGALHFDPEVDTIFEIGGQDSKYIRARDGRIYDSNMNYVCAAGTGSFVEEQAKKLGFELSEIGDMVMEVAPPFTSDRCTVFMEQDVDRLIREGYTRKECIAAVLYSVVQNYLNKVVGKRHYSRRKVFFQGATARNKGLVAAFENLLDVEMVVSPYCHVMGGMGTALMAKRAVAELGGKSNFKGLDLSNREITLRTEICELCQNHCKITVAEIEGELEKPSWGYMCGRDPESKKMRVNHEFVPFRRRISLLTKNRGVEPQAPKGTIGLPMALQTYSLYPLWQTLFQRLGYKVRSSKRTNDETASRGAELTAADFCFPIKLAHGHSVELASDREVDFVFLPYVIGKEHNPATTNSYVCPYVQAFPSVLRSSLKLHDFDIDRLVNPVVDFRQSEKSMLDSLHAAIGERLGVNRRELEVAWKEAQRAQDEFERECQDEGGRLLKKLEDEGKPGLVIMGRPYNTLDLGANLGLPQKIAELGITLIPLDMLPYDLSELNPTFRNMYWHYGQHIISAAEFVRKHPNLYSIYFTNFSCGPDSFLLSFVEDIMGDKPMLTLELDEHGGDAGYLTRVEAFLDVVKSWGKKALGAYHMHMPDSSPEEFKRRRILVPPMHPLGTPFLAAAMRGSGYDAVAMPPEEAATLDAGRSLTRGSECLPAAMTTGNLALELKKNEDVDYALFMPTASGPCRFGQYALLQRMVLNRLGKKDVPILSPSSENAYQGLDQRLRRRAWLAVLCADIIYKCRCKLRPYEENPGEVDDVYDLSTQDIVKCLENNGNVEEALARCIERFRTVPARDVGSKPLVGIVGEIYVRCNPFCNDNLIDFIEQMGGEAWLAPLSEWMLYTAEMHRWMASQKVFNFKDKLNAFLKNHFMIRDEHRYYEIAKPLLHDREEPPMEEIIEAGEPFVPVDFQGEAILTLGRAAMFCRTGASLVVNVAPFACMPGTITSALSRQIEIETRVPVVSLFYDGKEGQNDRLEVFFNNLASPDGKDATATSDAVEPLHEQK